MQRKKVVVAFWTSAARFAPVFMLAGAQSLLIFFVLRAKPVGRLEFYIFVVVGGESFSRKRGRREVKDGR